MSTLAKLKQPESGIGLDKEKTEAFIESFLGKKKKKKPEEEEKEEEGTTYGSGAGLSKSKADAFVKGFK